MSTYWKSQPFRIVDTTWLHMALSPTQTQVGGIVILQESLSLDQLKALVRSRLLGMDRFRQRVRRPGPWPLFPMWEEDPDFDINAHVHAMSLSAPADWAKLRGLFEDLIGVPLYPYSPLWQMVLVENYAQGSALIIRFEHAIADGDAAMHILDVLSDAEPEVPDHEAAPPPRHSTFLGTIQLAFDLGEWAASLPAGALKRIRTPRQLAQHGIGSLKAFNKLVFSPPDPQTVLRGQRSNAHRMAVSEPIALADIKATGKPLGATVNDVLLSAVCGGFRHYMQKRSEAVDDVAVRGIVPVSLRTRAEAVVLGNGFGLDFLPLPVDIADPVERLRVLKGRMDAIKDSPEAEVSYAIMHLLGVLPRSMQHLAVRFFSMKGSATMTNVAGPQQTRYLAGSRIERIMFCVPHPGEVAIGMSIMSYDGTVLVTLDTDASIIPQPQEIIDGFESDLAELRQRAEQLKPVEPGVSNDGRQPVLASAPAK